MKTVKLGLFGVFGCSWVHSSVAAPFHAPGITETNGKRFEDLNVKLVPRVFLDGNDGTGLDPAGNLPCARFSVANYSTGGRHPSGGSVWGCGWRQRSGIQRRSMTPGRTGRFAMRCPKGGDRDVLVYSDLSAAMGSRCEARTAG
jgi:hypothetical protein